MCCDYFISLNGIYNNPTLFILQHFLLRIETFRQKLGTMVINYSDQEVIKNKKSIFIAGPTPRDGNVKSWRTTAC